MPEITFEQAKVIFKDLLEQASGNTTLQQPEIFCEEVQRRGIAEFFCQGFYTEPPGLPRTREDFANYFGIDPGTATFALIVGGYVKRAAEYFWSTARFHNICQDFDKNHGIIEEKKPTFKQCLTNLDRKLVNLKRLTNTSNAAGELAPLIIEEDSDQIQLNFEEVAEVIEEVVTLRNELFAKQVQLSTDFEKLKGLKSYGKSTAFQTRKAKMRRAKNTIETEITRSTDLLMEYYKLAVEHEIDLPSAFDDVAPLQRQGATRNLRELDDNGLREGLERFKTKDPEDYEPEHDTWGETCATTCTVTLPGKTLGCLSAIRSALSKCCSKASGTPSTGTVTPDSPTGSQPVVEMMRRNA